ncbi:MAG: topoisomerase C-terminal repeat-containing protein [Ilumatobacteraceae bacterium]
MDADLDEIASGEQQKDEWLRRFYFGEDSLGGSDNGDADADHDGDALIGLKRLVEENLDKIDAAEINTFRLGADENGEIIVVKPGRYGPYVKRGDDTASVPDDLPPDELDVAKAIELLSLPKSDEPIGELDGYPVFAKNGRYGPYVQWGAPDNLPPGLEKPKMSSLFASMSLDSITMEDAEKLLQLPGRSARIRPTARRSSPTTADTGRTW